MLPSTGPLLVYLGDSGWRHGLAIVARAWGSPVSARVFVSPILLEHGLAIARLGVSSFACGLGSPFLLELGGSPVWLEAWARQFGSSFGGQHGVANIGSHLRCQSGALPQESGRCKCRKLAAARRGCRHLHDLPAIRCYESTCDTATLDAALHRWRLAAAQLGAFKLVGA